jgi:hypothetical protein
MKVGADRAATDPKLLYDASGGNTTGGIQMQEIGAELDLAEDETQQIVQWLVDRGLVRWFSFGGNISITPAGVDSAEAALPAREVEPGASRPIPDGRDARDVDRARGD